MNSLTEQHLQKAPGGENVWRLRANDELLQVLASSGQTQSLEAGGQLCALDAAAEGVFLIVRGSARAAMTVAPGRDLVCCTAGPGSVLGLPSALCSKSYQFDVTALEALEAVYLPAAELKAILRERPELCLQVMNMMCDELHALRQTRKHIQACAYQRCTLHDSCQQNRQQ